MLHFLSVLISEFHENNLKKNTQCKSPSTTDQWTMNWLYYNGKFGLASGEIKTLPWGVGPILTAGKACITKDKKTGASDLIEMDSSGQWLINRFDREVAAGVHQFDRCYPWIESYFKNKSHIFVYSGSPLLQPSGNRRVSTERKGGFELTTLAHYGYESTALRTSLNDSLS
jgi:hypothetical protein